MASTRFTQCQTVNLNIYESLKTMMYLECTMIRVVTQNTINSNLLKKLLLNMEKTKKIE